MDLKFTREEWSQEERRWLGSSMGTDHARTITIDPTGLVKATHYPKGFLQAGTALKKSGDGDYTLADATGFDGFLLSPVDVPVTGTDKFAGALLDHGKVIVANLPLQTGAGSLADVEDTATSHFILL